MLLVRACSPTCPEYPSLNSSLSIDSFPIICSKGSCFPLAVPFHRPTHLFRHVLLLAMCVLCFIKLLFHTPPLFQLETGLYIDSFVRSSTFFFSISMFLVSPFLASCLALLHSSHYLSYLCKGSNPTETSPSSFLELHRTPDIVQGRRLEKFLIPKIPFSITIDAPTYFHLFLLIACPSSSLIFPLSHHNH